jgi:hypothetical protein
MRRVTLVVVPFLAALFVARGVAQETPTATLAARYTSTPPIVQLTATAEAGTPAFCQRTASWTPLAGQQSFGSMWSLQVIEVRAESSLTIRLGQTVVDEATAVPGRTYVTVRARATNVTTNVLQSYPQEHLRLFDDQGRTYNADDQLSIRWIFVLNTPILDWEPGGTYEIAATYVVPDDARPAGLVAADGSLCMGLPTEGTPTA